MRAATGHNTYRRVPGTGVWWAEFSAVQFLPVVRPAAKGRKTGAFHTPALRAAGLALSKINKNAKLTDANIKGAFQPGIDAGAFDKAPVMCMQLKTTRNNATSIFVVGVIPGARVGMAMTSFCLVWLPGRSLCVAGAGWEYWGCGMQEPVAPVYHVLLPHASGSGTIRIGAGETGAAASTARMRGGRENFFVRFLFTTPATVQKGACVYACQPPVVPTATSRNARPPW